TYTVKKGDTLYSIAKNQKTTVDKIKSDNKLDSNSIKVGQILKIK
ncbi:LysM peptidoglycan-binding domain-containing protein, partial [Staphylococcus shinii]